MIKLVGKWPTGQRFVILGLSRENLKRLPNDMPILVKLADLGADKEPLDHIVLFAGETEEDMVEQLHRQGLIPDEH